MFLLSGRPTAGGSYARFGTRSPERDAEGGPVLALERCSKCLHGRGLAVTMRGMFTGLVESCVPILALEPVGTGARPISISRIVKDTSAIGGLEMPLGGLDRIRPGAWRPFTLRLDPAS